MKSKNYYFLTILIFTYFLSFSQYEVVKVKDSLGIYPKKYGFFYSLPKNYIIAHISIKKINRYKGPFSDYAEDMLGAKAIQANQTIYAINNINISLGYQSDLSELYYISYPNKIKDTSYYQFIKNGLIINEKTAASQSSNNQLQITFHNQNPKEQTMFDMYANYGMYEIIDTTYESHFIDSTYVQILKIEKHMAVKTTEEKAKETLDEIKNIREAQRLLLMGEHEVDYSNLEYMITRLKEQEEAFLSLFTGFTLSETIEYTYYYPLPDKSDTITIPLFSFTTTNGINKILENDTEIYSLQLTNTHSTDLIQKFIANIRNQNKKHLIESFYYRIPENYTASLSCNNKTLNIIGELSINQYGVINTLPHNVTSFEINPYTGNILNVKFK